MKGLDWAGALTNPLVIAGIRGNNPTFGDQLAAAALESRAQQTQNMQKQEFEAKQRDRVRAIQQEEVLRQQFGDINFTNPQQAMEQLIGKGLDATQALSIIGKHQDFINNKANVDINRGNLAVNQGHLGVAQGGLDLNRQKTAAEIQKLNNEAAGILTPKEKRKEDNETRKEFQALPITKETSIVKNTRDKIDGLVKKANSNPKGAGSLDTALITLSVKMNDAMSVVSPGEAASAKEAQGWFHKWGGQLQQIEAKGFLLPEDRVAIKTMADEAYRIQLNNYDEQKNKFKDIVKDYGGNEKNVFTFEPQGLAEAESQANNQTATGNYTPQDIEAERKKRGI